VIWVQADEPETERRNLARVGQPGCRDWMAEEVPFLADQRPRERADLIACGTAGAIGNRRLPPGMSRRMRLLLSLCNSSLSVAAQVAADLY
jgi:hypothetical protein